MFSENSNMSKSIFSSDLFQYFFLSFGLLWVFFMIHLALISFGLTWFHLLFYHLFGHLVELPTSVIWYLIITWRNSQSFLLQISSFSPFNTHIWHTLPSFGCLTVPGFSFYATKFPSLGIWGCYVCFVLLSFCFLLLEVSNIYSSLRSFLSHFFDLHYKHLIQVFFTTIDSYKGSAWRSLTC